MAPKRVYLLGGPSANRIYNPDNDSWTMGTSMPTPRNTDLGILAINEQYTPIGYGTISSPSPSATVPEMNILTVIITIAAITCAFLVSTKKYASTPT